MPDGSHTSKFAQLKALKQQGKSAIKDYVVEEDGAIYDELDEDSYKTLVRKRLDGDDFVVDDSGQGYVENGMDDWERQDEYYDSEEDEDEEPKKKKSKAKTTKQDSQFGKTGGTGDGSITSFLHRKPAQVQAKKILTSTEQDQDFMADILGNMADGRDADEGRVTVMRAKRGADENGAAKRRNMKFRNLSSSPPPLMTSNNANRTREQYAAVPFKSDTSLHLPVSDLPIYDNDDGYGMNEHHLDEVSSPIKKEDAEADHDDGFALRKLSTNNLRKQDQTVNASAARILVKPKDLASSLPSTTTNMLSSEPDLESWKEIEKSLVLAAEPTATVYGGAKIGAVDIVEGDGSVNFFWIDYIDINGVLGLFGKIYNKKAKSWASGFVKVDGVQRSLFFLPRETRVVNGVDTEEAVTMTDVYDEVDGLMSKFGIDSYKSKPATRNYAFELRNIPQRCDYLNVLYPYSNPPLPMDLQGQTFAHVFGTNTAVFEQFVLYRRIMGPCWLNVKEADFTMAQNATWCKAEFGVANPTSITTVKDLDVANLKESPPFTVVSLALRTLMNQRENRQEIVVASLRIYNEVHLDDHRSAETIPCQTFTVVRPLRGSYPGGFDQEIKKHRGAIRLEKSETALLNCILGMSYIMIRSNGK